MPTGRKHDNEPQTAFGAISALRAALLTAGLGASAVAGIAPFNIVRAQDAALKVGVLLPRSGAQAGIGQDCQRGVDIASGLLKDLGMPPLADHEWRHRNER